MNKLEEGFRPLHGDLISQLFIYIFLNASFRRFPSPSRGSYFSIDATYCSLREQGKFPSPSRGSYFSISFLKRQNHKIDLSFRPLPGDLISQFFNMIFMFMSYLLKFPSPSRGSYFSILSFTCLILTGFQSRIAAQNQIRLWNKLLSP